VRFPVPATIALVAGLVSCSSPSSSSSDTVRLGYFPNLTHAAALLGVADGTFADALKAPATLQPVLFNSGTEATEAIFNEAVDITFVGPSPAINAFAESNGEAVRIIAGATSGGASLVVRDGIEKPSDLTGSTLATPSLGNTQDVALRAWLAEQGFETTLTGGGDVAITPLSNSDTLSAFASGDLDGAWVPEPYATRLVLEQQAHVLVDERDLWPNKEFITTQVMVSKSFLDAHPEHVKSILEALVKLTDRLVDDPEGSKELINSELEKLSGAPLNEEVLDKAWEQLHFTLDPLADSLRTGARHAETVGLLESVDLEGLYELDLLNEVLREAGKDPVAA
jgi:NitT/TauT family transport system substrate-binding protein